MMSLCEVVALFDGITLAEMDRVKLMNRTDRKYWFNTCQLGDLLCDIKDDYYLLEIERERNLPYATTYYDTIEDHMYNSHHRGKLNRYKIRRRSYIQSGISFLEVKFKSNKGRTIKERIPTQMSIEGFNAQEALFIKDKTPYTTTDLCVSLENSFRRLMLVSRDMRERCTIDQQLIFRSCGNEIALDDLVVVEVKSEGHAPSKIIDAMRRRHIHPSGFSKYCIGRSLTNRGLRSNLFKQKHRQISKIIPNINL